MRSNLHRLLLVTTCTDDDRAVLLIVSAFDRPYGYEQSAVDARAKALRACSERITCFCDAALLRIGGRANVKSDAVESLWNVSCCVCVLAC
jgi:hypothetical protein